MWGLSDSLSHGEGSVSFQCPPIGKAYRSLKGEDRMHTWTGMLGHDHVTLLLLADGHGGPDVADWCSRNTLSDVRMFANDDGSSSSLQSACLRAFSHAAEEVLKLMNGTCKAGSTLTVVCVNATLGELTCASLGDSSAFLIPHADDCQSSSTAALPQPVTMTCDHRLATSEEERQRVLAAGGKLAQARSSNGQPEGPLRAWPGGLAIARTIGDADCGAFIHSVPAIRSFRVPATGASIVVGSDGVWDSFEGKLDSISVVVHKSTRGVMRRRPSSQLLAESIIAKAVSARGGLCDDTSCIFLHLWPVDNDDSDDPQSDSGHSRSNYRLGGLWHTTSRRRSASVEPLRANTAAAASTAGASLHGHHKGSSSSSGEASRHPNGNLSHHGFRQAFWRGGSGSSSERESSPGMSQHGPSLGSSAESSPEHSRHGQRRGRSLLYSVALGLGQGIGSLKSSPLAIRRAIGMLNSSTPVRVGVNVGAPPTTARSSPAAGGGEARSFEVAPVQLFSDERREEPPPQPRSPVRVTAAPLKFREDTDGTVSTAEIDEDELEDVKMGDSVRGGAAFAPNAR